MTIGISHHGQANGRTLPVSQGAPETFSLCPVTSNGQEGSQQLLNGKQGSIDLALHSPHLCSAAPLAQSLRLDA